MSIKNIYTPEKITQKAKDLFVEERAKKRLDGWFYIKEIQKNCAEKYADCPRELKSAELLREVAKALPISISEHAIFAGTQSDSFARSYALINPSFEVESFAGYCDPTAVFGDIEPNEEITREKIEEMRAYDKKSDYVKALDNTYTPVRQYTGEVAFFIEQVTGHVIADFRPALAHGVNALIAEVDEKLKTVTDETRRTNYRAMRIALESVLILAQRYADCADALAQTAGEARKAELKLLADTLRRVPASGASNLYEAIQSFILLWQVMCMEQSPNPFAFSVGNADRIFEPYRAKEDLDRGTAAALLKHLLVFYNVGDRSWAISQNLIAGGKANDGTDLTNPTTYALFDAYYDMNLPQPILSVKLHKNTPAELYAEMGRFFFTPGCLTPSLFNDDSMFEVLRASGVEDCDLEDYAIAGCQEPLIMGRDNGNTTNSWLNLAKILELTLTGGVSSITGAEIGSVHKMADPASLLKNIRTLFYENLDFYVKKMVEAANNASRAVSLLPVPFLSTLMGGIESGYDMRDTEHQGTKYNGSGCLIHGLSIVADSFTAIDRLLAERPQDAQRLLDAIKNNFEGDEELRQYLLTCPKYGNNIEGVDLETAEIANKVSDLISSQKNYLGNPFRPDYATPSTHLLYGYWVGATPDGRNAREMLGYGIDPFYGDAQSGLGFRTLSNMRLPFGKMNGGYASHFGIDPKYFKTKTYEEKGIEFKNRVIAPLFFNAANNQLAPFYLYVNVTTPEILRKVMENPKKYAPSGVYIMRIHGTFVNFLDLSPAIQNDIIKRLDLESTSM
ncbi:pyruvate formate lyase family protein [Hydrogenoanaerobacterium sp.]|uniref:pyruvate formate lyase family protein n=1 Tax=Hydrogenoanaerobacterium sp. TaxID=2953763 RepID=UPI0028A2BAA2|nr:pyruvate formate lyase family protein [Hydrogenoanaerobacterium sp.]